MARMMYHLRMRTQDHRGRLQRIGRHVRARQLIVANSEATMKTTADWDSMQRPMKTTTMPRPSTRSAQTLGPAHRDQSRGQGPR